MHHYGIHGWWVLISFGPTLLFASYKWSIAHRTQLLFLVAEVFFALEEQNVISKVSKLFEQKL